MVGAKPPAWAMKAAEKIAALIWTGERSALELPDEPEMVRIIADACPAGKLAEALDGLLPLAEKMFGYLQKTAAMGAARMQPEGTTFEDLKFVKQARAALKEWRESQ